MDPISLAIGAIGMGVSAFGMFGASNTAKKVSDIQNNILAEQSYENQIRKQAVNIQAQRTQIQNVRNIQRAQSSGLATAIAQGGWGSSALGGGQAQARTAGGWNIEGTDQSVLSANKIFDTDAIIDQDKMNLGSTEATLAQDKSIQSLGGSIFGSAQSLGRLAGGFGGLFGGSQPSGTDVTGGLFNSLNRFPF